MSGPNQDLPGRLDDLKFVRQQRSSPQLLSQTDGVGSCGLGWSVWQFQPFCGRRWPGRLREPSSGFSINCARRRSRATKNSLSADAFKIGSTIGDRTLSAVGLGFAKHFLGVVEPNVPPISLGTWTLQYTAGDISLIKALGGERSAAVPFLAHIHRVMAMGTEGIGHTDWRSNLAYMRSPVDGQAVGGALDSELCRRMEHRRRLRPARAPRLARRLKIVRTRADRGDE